MYFEAPSKIRLIFNALLKSRKENRKNIAYKLKNVMT